MSAAGAGSLSPRSTFSAHPNYYFGVNSGDAMTNAKNYYFNALQKATEYVNNLSSLADIDTTSVLPVPSEVEEIETSDGLFVQKDVVHTVIVSNLTPEDKFIIGKGTTGTGVDLLLIQSLENMGTMLELFGILAKKSLKDMLEFMNLKEILHHGQVLMKLI